MKRDNSDNELLEDEILPEYDFRGGVRGKHVRAYRQGYTVTIRHDDGTETIQKVEPEPGVVVLDPDLRPYFPDSETVNRVLRTLVELVPRHPAQRK